MHLETLDFLVLGAYFAGLLLLGHWFQRQASSDDYFLANRTNASWLAGISVVATLLSTVTYLALPGEMIRNGAGYFTSLLAFLFIIPTVNRLIIPMLMRLSAASIYDYLERRYSRSVRHLGAGIFVATRLTWMSLIMYIAARSLHPMTGWSVPLLVLSTGCVTIIYTTLGGMRAVVWSDFAQFVILFGGVLFIPIYIGVQTSSTPVEWLRVFGEAERSSVPLFSFDPTERTTIVGMIVMPLRLEYLHSRRRSGRCAAIFEHSVRRGCQTIFLGLLDRQHWIAVADHGRWPGIVLLPISCRRIADRRVSIDDSTDRRRRLSRVPGKATSARRFRSHVGRSVGCGHVER